MTQLRTKVMMSSAFASNDDMEFVLLKITFTWCHRRTDD